MVNVAETEANESIDRRAMEGALYRYGIGSSHVAFTHGSGSKHLIVIGGLTDGWLATRYVMPLAKRVGTMGWSTTQANLSSSYVGYGIVSIEQDAREIEMLIEHLRKERMAREVIVLGHSTGCQDAVRLALTSIGDGRPDGVVLQAPVSDREWHEQRSEYDHWLGIAKEMQAHGEEEELMPRKADPCGVPITAKRFLSLASRGGEDDMFSSDFTDAELKQVLGHLDDLPTLMVLSGRDEYVKPGLDATVHGGRLAAAAGKQTTLRVIHDGDHALSKHTREFVDTVCSWLQLHFP